MTIKARMLDPKPLNSIQPLIEPLHERLKEPYSLYYEPPTRLILGTALRGELSSCHAKSLGLDSQSLQPPPPQLRKTFETMAATLVSPLRYIP